MIDPIKLMEFFEKQSGVKFVDVITGKNAIDLIKETHVCGKCEYGARGDGVTGFVEDIVCVNADSRHVTDFRMETTPANFGKQRKRRRIRNNEKFSNYTKNSRYYTD